MANKLSNNDRDILSFRPDIQFIEPEIEDPIIDPLTEDRPQIEEVEDNIKRIRNFADAVDTLAAAVQARADDKAKNMKVCLDPKVDAAIIQALRRRFGNDAVPCITYEQYRECKDLLRQYALNLGDNMLSTPDKVNNARDQAANTLSGNNSILNDDGGRTTTPAGTASGLKLGGLNTPGARTGGLRPELDTNTQVIPPIDVDEFQINMICILVNYIWQKFIKPILDLVFIPVANVTLGLLMPEELCDEGDVAKIPVPILGK